MRGLNILYYESKSNIKEEEGVESEGGVEGNTTVSESDRVIVGRVI